MVGFELGESDVDAVLTSDGRLECDTLVLAPGPWVARLWDLLGLDPLVHYWKAQEGEFALPGAGLSGRAGGEAPVVHLDQSVPLRSDRDGRALVDGPWGIYFRMGRTGTGITGGGLPVLLDAPELDPYGPDATLPSVRFRGSAPGLELAVSLVVAGGARRVSSQPSTLPQLWIRVKVVPHLPGSANSASASRRSEASSSSLSVSSRRDSSATLNCSGRRR